MNQNAPTKFTTVFYRKSNRHNWLRAGAGVFGSDQFTVLVFRTQKWLKGHNGWSVGWTDNGENSGGGVIGGDIPSSLPRSASVTIAPDLLEVYRPDWTEYGNLILLRQAIEERGAGA